MQRSIELKMDTVKQVVFEKFYLNNREIFCILHRINHDDPIFLFLKQFNCLDHVL